MLSAGCVVTTALSLVRHEWYGNLFFLSMSFRGNLHHEYLGWLPSTQIGSSWYWIILFPLLSPLECVSFFQMCDHRKPCLLLQHENPQWLHAQSVWVWPKNAGHKRGFGFSLRSDQAHWRQSKEAKKYIKLMVAFPPCYHPVSCQI